LKEFGQFKDLTVWLEILHNRLPTKYSSLEEGLQNLAAHSCVVGCNLDETTKYLFFDSLVSKNFKSPTSDR